MYHLYVKTHNVTGLKYLGYTKENPHKYKGSGKRWLRHIAKHGNDVTTEIMGTYDTMDQIREWGIHYSQLWNIVESKEWANLTIEEGNGGFEYINRSGVNIGNTYGIALRGYRQAPEHRNKRIEKLIGRTRSDLERHNISKGKLGKPLYHLHTRKQCPHCLNSFTPGPYGQWHGDKCKEKKHELYSTSY